MKLGSQREVASRFSEARARQRALKAARVDWGSGIELCPGDACENGREPDSPDFSLIIQNIKYGASQSHLRLFFSGKKEIAERIGYKPPLIYLYPLQHVGVGA